MRRLLATHSARLGLIVGTWAELLELATQAYAITVEDNDNWDEQLRMAANNLSESFWLESLNVNYKQQQMK